MYADEGGARGSHVMPCEGHHAQSLEALAARGLSRAPKGWRSSVFYYVPVRPDNRVYATGPRRAEIPILKFNKVENATPFPTN
jgi:hypothetical protein